jgi:RNA polymerase sigma factor (TIGR02999 family)
MDDLTRLLNKADGEGGVEAEALLPLVYQKLRQVAAEKIGRERDGQTLQATALVHEAWLRVGGEQHGWRNRWHFFNAAAEAMRRILIDRARRRRAVRHGGALQRVNVDDVEIAVPAADAELLDVHEALDRLAVAHPRKAALVKLRYFAGLSMAEAAEVIGISLPTAERHWAFARAWLYRDVTKRHGSSDGPRYPGGDGAR